ncbi:MAG: hypothetical protein HY830_13065 [Actinobacteria bacterium]|nr:hypothetical protein [Actinomycetota bacterium]
MLTHRGGFASFVMEGPVAWFAWQSALFILLAFVLGCLVGYWYWRIQYRKAAFTESEAVTVISRRHEKAVAEKDAEIGRLQSLLAGGAGAAAVAGSVDAEDGTAPDADGDAVPSTDTDATVVSAVVSAEADAVVDGAGGAEGDDAAPTTDATDDDTSAEVTDAQVTVADGTDAEGTAEADAADADVQDTADAAGTPDAEPVTVVALPEDSDLPEETVVDVTDDAVAGTDAVANAVAQLPTQSTGEGDVIDLSAVEDGAGTDGAAQDATVADETVAEPVADAAPDADGAVAAAAPGVAAGLVSATAGADDDSVEDDSAEDDLERIEGIGPRIASALRSAGIRSFRRLADADVPTLQAALEAAGLRFAPSLPTWSRQARFLADGDEVGFIKLTESLVAGREPGRSR